MTTKVRSSALAWPAEKAMARARSFSLISSADRPAMVDQQPLQLATPSIFSSAFMISERPSEKKNRISPVCVGQAQLLDALLAEVVQPQGHAARRKLQAVPRVHLVKQGRGMAGTGKDQVLVLQVEAHQVDGDEGDLFEGVLQAEVAFVEDGRRLLARLLQAVHDALQLGHVEGGLGALARDVGHQHRQELARGGGSSRNSRRRSRWPGC